MKLMQSDAPMQIVHVVRQYVPFIGGLEFVVHDLAREQVKLGHAVRVVTLERRLGAGQDKLPREEVLDGVVVRRISHFGPRRYPVAPGVLRHLRDADVVHVHAIDFFFDFLAICNIALRKTLVISTHGGFFHTDKFSSLKKLWFKSLTRMSLNSYSAVICVSHQDEETFRSIRTQGIRALLNGVDVSKFKAAAPISIERSLVTIGRFAPNKGYDRLLDTLIELNQGGDWKLTILGGADQLSAADIEVMISERNLQDVVQLIVSPSNEEMKAHLATASAFISASSYEGFGVAAVEALSAGLPVILNDIKPYRSLVNSLGQGALVNFAEPRDAAQKIEQWRCEFDDTSDARERRIAFASGFGNEQVARETVQLYGAATGRATRLISGLEVDVLSPAEAIETIDARLRTNSATKIIFANSNLITRLTVEEKRAFSKDEDTIVLNDGIALDTASLFIYGKSFPSNLNGSDFMGAMLSGLQSRLRIFLLGGKPGVAEEAARVLLKIYPDHEIVGLHHGYYDSAQLPGIVSKIRASGADTLLCAMGNPIQERWLKEHLDDCGCRLGIAVGAYLDFVSGKMPRAPTWVRKARLEWLYRLAIEPRRLASRYTWGIARFFGGVVGQVLRGYRVQ